MTCWTGPSSAFELKLQSPLSAYALEQLRQRFLFALTTDHSGVKSARVLLQMAFETEVGIILVKQLTPPTGLQTADVCERRRYIDVDQDVRLQSYLIAPSLDAFAQTPNVPAAYVDFITRYVASGSPRYRMCALAVMLCITTVLKP